MKLPQRILDQVEWFETGIEKDYWEGTIYTTFTLHFRAWWRRRKVIKIVGIYACTDADGVKRFDHSPHATELLAQLTAHCKL